jgi:AcrR family transcriptional regulator
MTLTPYEQAQHIGQDAVRTAILDKAITLLIGEGPAALTVRRIATEVGCSTKVLYTLFQGKEGLAAALWREGFARFGKALGDVPHHPDPVEYLDALGMAYRAYAHAEPAYYKVMFEGVIPGFSPDPDAYRASRLPFGILEAACTACVETGRFAGDPRDIANLIWMAVHGAVSLELSGFFTLEQGDQLYRALCDSLIASFTA